MSWNRAGHKLARAGSELNPTPRLDPSRPEQDLRWKLWKSQPKVGFGTELDRWTEPDPTGPKLEIVEKPAEGWLWNLSWTRTRTGLELIRAGPELPELDPSWTELDPRSRT